MHCRCFVRKRIPCIENIDLKRHQFHKFRIPDTKIICSFPYPFVVGSLECMKCADRNKTGRSTNRGFLHRCVHIGPWDKSASLHPRCIPTGHAGVRVNLWRTVHLKENSNYSKMPDKGWQKGKIKGIHFLRNRN